MKAGAYKLTIRRNIGRRVRPEAEPLDGKVFKFRPGWLMEESDPYPGEWAMIPERNQGWPDEAPVWWSSGDMELAE